MYSKKEIILETAFVLFTKYGFQCISMDNIANKCGVSKRTIYKHFRNKVDIINQIIEIKASEFIHKLEGITFSSENAVIELNQFFKFYNEIIPSFSPTLIRDFKHYNLTFYLECSKINKKSILPFLTKNIERGQQEGLYKKELNTDEIGESVLNMLGLLFTDDALLNFENSYSILNFFANLLINRLVSTKGMQHLNALH
ncbi:TetR/AcrR family transcriptional regulator [Maribacter sp.]|uniref:TetR/AcrR family transcriptional regulator n=1 Tax=Maribacter sp. TaxID=1897614 RepID=UPI0025C5EFA6|nr:TetR/AcrR family transcriptional regulator [Maribacter sp.]